KTIKNCETVVAMDESPGKKNEERFCFGEFTLDVLHRCLYCGTERIHVTPKPLETLIYLVQHQGETVTKQRLLEEVWRNTAVTEGTLVQAVREIRKALGDDKGNPRFIQTIPREGYRFVGRVTSNSPSMVLPPLTSQHPLTVKPAPWFKVTLASAVILALSGVLFVAVWRGRDSPHLSATTAVPWPMPVRQLTSGTISAVKPM